MISVEALSSPMLSFLEREAIALEKAALEAVDI